MWSEAVAFVKSLFSGKSSIQIGKDQQSVSGTTKGANSPVLTAGRDINYNAQHSAPSATERDAELLAEMRDLMPEIIENLRELLKEDPILRDIVVMERSTFAYGWPGPHGKFVSVL